MRTMQNRNAKHSMGVATPFCMDGMPNRGQAGPGNGMAAVMDALGALENVVSIQCVCRPDTLTPDGITAYALALLRLRECASAAGVDRLTNACDALAVTVSRLIEDKNCASSDKCESLTRFVAHARAMIQMYADGATRHPVPIAAPRN